MSWDERIARRMKLRDLATLRLLAEVGSMAKAAERSGTSQPAISKAMADLEHTLGVPLLDRTTRGVELTAYGRALLKHGATMFDGLRQGLAEIEYLRDPSQGELRIGAPEPVTTMLAKIVNAFGVSYPKVRFTVIVGDTPLLFEALRERQIDVAFTRLPDLDAAPDLTTEALLQDPLLVVAGRKNSWTRRRNVTLGDLVSEPWVLPPPDTVLGRFGIEIFMNRGLKAPRVSIVSPSLQMRLSLMTDGPYLSLLPSAMLMPGAAALAIAPLRVPLTETKRPVGLVTLKGRSNSPLLDSFIVTARKMTATFRTSVASRARKN